MIDFQGQPVTVVTGDMEAGWVILLLPDGRHREVTLDEVHDAQRVPVNHAVMALAISQANQSIGFSWICMVREPLTAPCAVAGFLNEREALLYALAARVPVEVIPPAEFLRERSRWWQRQHPTGYPFAGETGRV